MSWWGRRSVVPSWWRHVTKCALAFCPCKPICDLLPHWLWTNAQSFEPRYEAESALSFQGAEARVERFAAKLRHSEVHLLAKHGVKSRIDDLEGRHAVPGQYLFWEYSIVYEYIHVYSYIRTSYIYRDLLPCDGYNYMRMVLVVDQLAVTMKGSSPP